MNYGEYFPKVAKFQKEDPIKELPVDTILSRTFFGSPKNTCNLIPFFEIVDKIHCTV